jgi:hypothetical protein
MDKYYNYGPEKRLAVDNDAVTWNPSDQNGRMLERILQRVRLPFIWYFKLAKRASYEQG